MLKYRLMQKSIVERYLLVGWRFLQWARGGYAGCLPQPVKEGVFERFHIRGAPWVETGTFVGTSTRFLSSLGPKVYSLEPSPIFFDLSTERFNGRQNVEIIHGSSEDKLDEVLSRLSGPVNFWLDGHYSAGATFEGESHCPVPLELEIISKHLSRLGRIAVMIDDAAHFASGLPEDKDYPSLDYLVDWARGHNLEWRIDSDIIVIRSPM